MHGKHFTENSKYLFLYASKHAASVSSVFISKRKKIVRFLRENGMKAEYLYTFKGIKTVLRAKKAFIDHSINDINPMLLGGTEIIQLWHGTPIKKIGYDSDWNSFDWKTKIRKCIMRMLVKIFPYLYGPVVFDKLIISSEIVKEGFKSGFKVSPQKMIILGQPRNDCLDSQYFLDENLFPEQTFLNKLKNDTDIIITWLPTYRRHPQYNIVNLFNNYAFNEGDFEQFLNDHNGRLVIKAHVLEKTALANIIKDKKHIVNYNYADPYPLLRITDILITDYSSVYLDFLLLNKPIIFAPFDMSDYQKSSASFYYDYEKVTPGSKCHNWNEVLLELKKLVKIINESRKDSYYEKRIEINNMFNYYKNNFSKRIVDELFAS